MNETSMKDTLISAVERTIKEQTDAAEAAKYQEVLNALIATPSEDIEKYAKEIAYNK